MLQDQDSEHRQSGRFSRRQNWYLKGWQKEEVKKPNGKTYTDWVYRGSYYDFPPEAPRLELRVTAAVCTTILLAVYLFAAFCPTEGGKTVYVGYPYLFGILPLIYFVMGAFWYVCTPGKMTYRRYYASVLRLRVAGRIGILCMAVSFVGELVFLFLSFGTVPLGKDLLFLVCIIICTAQYFLLLQAEKKYPVAEVAAPDGEPLDKSE